MFVRSATPPFDNVELAYRSLRRASPVRESDQGSGRCHDRLKCSFSSLERPPTPNSSSSSSKEARWGASRFLRGSPRASPGPSTAPTFHARHRRRRPSRRLLGPYVRRVPHLPGLPIPANPSPCRTRRRLTPSLRRCPCSRPIFFPVRPPADAEGLYDLAFRDHPPRRQPQVADRAAQRGLRPLRKAFPAVARAQVRGQRGYNSFHRPPVRHVSRKPTPVSSEGDTSVYDSVSEATGNGSPSSRGRGP